MTRLLILLPLLLTACLSLDMPAQTVTPTQPAATHTATATQTATRTVTATETTCTVTADALNVREGAGLEHPVIGWLRAGDVVSVLDRRGAWLLTRAGWIHSHFCER